MIRAIVKAKQTNLKSVSPSNKNAKLEDSILQDSKYYHDGAWHDIKIYDRSKLMEGMKIPGPAIVSEMDSTTVILPDHNALVDKVGNLIINPEN